MEDLLEWLQWFLGTVPGKITAVLAFLTAGVTAWKAFLKDWARVVHRWTGNHVFDYDVKVPSETLRMVERDAHIWTMAEDPKRNNFEAANFQCGLLVTNITDEEIEVAHVVITPPPTPYRTKLVVMSTEDRHQALILAPKDRCELIVSFWVDPATMGGLIAVDDIPATVTLVDQFNNRHPIPLTFHRVERRRDEA